MQWNTLNAIDYIDVRCTGSQTSRRRTAYALASDKETLRKTPGGVGTDGSAPGLAFEARRGKSSGESAMVVGHAASSTTTLGEDLAPCALERPRAECSATFCLLDLRG